MASIPTSHQHSHSPSHVHDHVFLGSNHDRNEKRTWMVIAITFIMMIIEIAAGSLFGSMALLADGFHMSTHAAALLITALAYLYARRHAQDERFSFGTGKIGDLAGFSSAIILAIVALAIGFESLMRLYAPVQIRFGEAIMVAVIGLVVNMICAALLHQGGGHDHGHHHHEHNHAHDDHKHDHHAHKDNNLQAAYLHVLADALTSVFAIIGLLAGWIYGWVWMDAAVGLLGAIVIGRWSIGLMRQSGGLLLDMLPAQDKADAIRAALTSDADAITDLHLWQIGPGHMAAVVAIESRTPATPDCYRAKLAGIKGLSHISIEVNPAPFHS